MANVNLNDNLHDRLWQQYEKADKIEFPSFKNFVEKALEHSQSCGDFAGNKKKPNTR